jgi:Ca-activated chloride channel family protein
MLAMLAMSTIPLGFPMKQSLLVVMLALGAVAVVAAQQTTFRAGVDLVHFGVVVTDRQGAPITGLKAEDFEIVEEGKTQAVKYFAAGDPALAPPLHLGLALDTSGSMEDDIKDVRTALVKFLNSMADAVDITLVDFDTEVRVARFGPNDIPRLIERIRLRKADGWTALYDALGVYLNGAADQDGQKILVLYTDGADTRSSSTLNDTMNLLRASDVTLYAIGYLEHQTSTGRMEQRMQLQRFAWETGGQALFPSSVKDVDKMYEKIREEISARYSLGYNSTDERTNGAWRDVNIRLKRPDLKGAKLRTRAGYFAPYRKQ